MIFFKMFFCIVLTVFVLSILWVVLADYCDKNNHIFHSCFDSLDSSLNLSVRTISDTVVLDILSYSTNYDIRWLVACNPNTSAGTLSHMAEDKYVDIRCAVAKHRNTDATTLGYLATDKSRWVRLAVACHKNANDATIQFLQTDKDEWVRIVILARLNTNLKDKENEQHAAGSQEP